MTKQKKNKSGLTVADVKKFKERLLAKRREILGDVNHMEDETLRKDNTELSSLPIHMADMGTDNYEMEKTLGLMDSERKLVMEIDAALQRIQDGKYGICEGSGEPIGKARLKAIPWAKYSVAYAELLEKGLVQEVTDEEYENPDEIDKDEEKPGLLVVGEDEDELAGDEDSEDI